MLKEMSKSSLETGDAMKAVVKEAPGNDHMVYKDIPEPEATGDLVKIRVAYNGICGTDLHAFRGEYSSTKTPVVLGHELSGVVTAVGPDVKDVKVGDRVTTETTFSTCGHCASCKTKDYNLCGHRQGIGTQVNGGMAEYLVSRAESVHVLPDNVSLLSAALTEPLACGVHAALEKADVQKGEKVCIFGSGAIGQMVLQACKSRGCYVIVAGLPQDAERFELAKSAGADRCVDQTVEDLSKIVFDMTDDEGVDVSFECSGAVPAANKALEITRRKGRVIQMGVFKDAAVPLRADYVLHKEICYMGSRSQKPSSWRTSIQLLSEGKVVPEKIVTMIVPLEKWRDGFDAVARGEGVKAVICCSEELAEQDKAR